MDGHDSELPRVQGRFYVSHDVKHLASMAEGQRTWWCVAKTSNTGDIGIIYQTEHGLRFVFRVLQIEEDNQFCKSFLMATAQIEMMSVINPAITVSKLRSQSQFKGLKAIRRNFQNRWFDIEETHLASLLDFLCGKLC